ncbi:MarR family transcriptional regulator [Streptomyces sp. BE147]|uniref:LexA family protein n=1 Tax=Streptomyces sp. BE147 TaxID=3002524 RepID=UPI002E76E52A|nr:MarR family transcriptional regulator [Streptomyces sp. BE147]
MASVLVHPGRLDARCPGGAAAADPPEPTGGRGVRGEARALSARQEAIIAVIRSWLTEHGEGPTVRELGARVGLSSTSSVAHQLARLEKRGLIRRTGRDWSTCYLVTPEPPRRGLRSR